MSGLTPFAGNLRVQDIAIHMQWSGELPLLPERERRAMGARIFHVLGTASTMLPTMEKPR